MVLMAEDRLTAFGVVGADALEDTRAVVKGVREYVYLRVLPGDELAVHPNEVRGVHVFPPFRGAIGRPSWRPRCWRRRRGPGSEGRSRGPCRWPILSRPPPLPYRVRSGASSPPSRTSPADWPCRCPRCRAPSRGRA